MKRRAARLLAPRREGAVPAVADARGMEATGTVVMSARRRGVYGGVHGNTWELVGRWQLRRRIHDRLVGVYGTVAGELVVVPDGDPRKDQIT